MKKGGWGDLSRSNTDFLVARLLSNGRPDPLFGQEGYQFVDFKNGVDAAHALALDPTGRIVVAGDGRIGGAGPTGTGYWPAGFIALTRLLPDGRLDQRFGRKGKAIMSFENHGRGEVTTMTLLGVNKILVGGSAGNRGTISWFPAPY